MTYYGEIEEWMKSSEIIETLKRRIEELEDWNLQLQSFEHLHDITDKRRKDRIAELEAALRDAYEVYAGSDGFIPETAAEGYQQQLIKQMMDVIGAALAKANTDLLAVRAAMGEKDAG